MKTIIIHPDDQLLDFIIYQRKIQRARDDVRKFFTGYTFWANFCRRVS